MENRLVLPTVRYTLPTLTGIALFALLLANPDTDHLLAGGILVALFGILFMALRDRINAINENPPHSSQTAVDGGSFLSSSMQNEQQIPVDTPIQSGDGGSFPRSAGSFFGNKNIKNIRDSDRRHQPAPQLTHRKRSAGLHCQ